MRGARADSHDVVIPLVGFNPSGGVRMVIHVANALAARGARVVFSVPAHAATPPIELHAGVAVTVRGAARGLRDRIALCARLPRARVYVATGYQTPLLIAIGVAWRAPRPRIVYLIQNDEPVSHIAYGRQPVWLKPALVALARAGYRVPARRIAVSRFVAERVGRGRVHRVIPPGIDRTFLDRAARERAPSPDGPLTVGVLSHGGAVKGMDVAIGAFESLLEDVRLRFVAFDGAYPVALSPFIRPFSSLSSRRPIDVVDFYGACDVFVFPSRVEGFGLPPLEAMACGAAVVLTDSGGVREYAQDGSNCLVVPPGDAGAIAAAVGRLAADAALRARLIRGGFETAVRFPAERFASACADEIERLLAAPRQRADAPRNPG